MEESLLKTHFLGRDGFRWWVGQIPALNPEMEQQVSGSGWGNRYPVRIMGYHPYSQEELPDEDLPWALVILPPGVGSGGGGVSKSVKFTPGDVVTGFFLDGDNAQQPVIFGTFGKTQYQALSKDKLPFTAFTGYNTKIKKPDGSVLKSKGQETNESNAASAPSPRALSPEKAKNLTDNASLSGSIGKKISLPCGQSCNAQILNKVQTALEQFIFDIKNLKSQVDMGLEWAKDWINKEIDYRAEQITGILSGYVGGIMNKVYEKLIPTLRSALKAMHDEIIAVLTPSIGFAAAKSAAIAALKVMIGPIKQIQNQLACLTNQIIKSLTNTVADILKSIADNAINFVDCLADQFIGGITNGVFDQILDGMTPLFAALETVQYAQVFKLLGKDFNFEQDILRKVSDIGESIVDGLADVFVCDKPSPQDKYGACEYRIGSGPGKRKSLDIGKIVKDANAAKAISLVAGGTLDDLATAYGAFTAFTKDISVPDFSSAFGECYAGIPQFCGPPTINIFGGEGDGTATAEPVFGFNVLGDNGKTTGSIISYKVTNPGGKFKFPPFVEVVDNCDQGYGAQAKAILKPDGTLDKIVPKNDKTIGENYPSDEDPDIEKKIAEVLPLQTGTDYEPGDTISDQFGNEYKPTIVNGGITKVTPINNPTFTELPVLTVNSDTGSGAILVPILENVQEDVVVAPGDVQSVIDCIT